jgi:hypothetical protein
VNGVGRHYLIDTNGCEELGVCRLIFECNGGYDFTNG